MIADPQIQRVLHKLGKFGSLRVRDEFTCLGVRPRSWGVTAALDRRCRRATTGVQVCQCNDWEEGTVMGNPVGRLSGNRL